MMKAEDAIEPSWYETYCKHRDHLFDQLKTLHIRLFILEEIEPPLILFIPNRDDRLFWDTIRYSLAETIIMGIFRIAVDPGSKRGNKETLTLRILKNRIFKHCDQSAKDYLSECCKKADFDGRLTTFEKNIRAIRNDYLAHFNLNPEDVEPLTVNEFRELLNILTDLLRILFFDTDFPPNLLVYPNETNNLLSAINAALESPIRDSYHLNWPERSDPLCADWIQRLSEDNLNLYNKYRRKFGKLEKHPKDHS